MSWISFSRPAQLADTYRVEVISLAQQLEKLSSLPLELQYIAHKRPDLLARLKKLLMGLRLLVLER